MPEDLPTEPPAEKKGTNWDKGGGFRPGAKMRSAIWEIVGKKKLGLKPEYKLVALKWGVKETSLETLYRRYVNGKVILDDPKSGTEEKAADIKVENERGLALLTKYEALLNDSFERMLVQAQKEFAEGNDAAVLRLELPAFRREMENVRRHRIVLEKGSFNLLEALSAAARAHQNGNGGPPHGGPIIEQNNIHIHNGPPAEKPVHAREIPAQGLTAHIAKAAGQHATELEGIFHGQAPQP